jgi:macrolide transport system ATP-binding/permease protein
MSTYLQISNLTKSYGLHTVLNGVSFVLNAGERIGLVGANGVGKSTLLKIIMGEVTPDSGSVMLPTGLQLGYLRQALTDIEGKTVAHLVDEALAGLRALEAHMRALEAQMSTASGAVLDEVMAAYGDAAEQFERRGGYEIDYRLDTVLAGLRVDHIPRDRMFASLSGGERARVGLGLLLLQAPDVLLLDEPTNHLDFATLEWLEGYLASYRGAILIVSHDREFLNRTVGTIIEIDEHSRTAKRYTGDYDDYARTKAQERAKWRAEYAAQQDEIKALRIEIKEGAHRNNNYRAHTDNDKFVIHIKKQTHAETVSKRIRAAEERLSRLLENPIPEPPDDLHFDPELNVQKLEGRLPVWASGISKAFGERCVLRDVSFALDLNSRVVLVGPNGAGKSTLLKLIVGDVKPDSGEIYVHPAVRIGYLTQDEPRFDGLTLFEAYCSGVAGDPQMLKAKLIKSGLFPYRDFDKPVASLSSGEGRKLQIARLIASRANLLVLDEPTNHVSFEVLEGLEDAIRQFPGPVIAASHDRRFIQRFGGEVWEVAEGQLVRSVMTP